jgi:hypothetical protein
MQERKDVAAAEQIERARLLLEQVVLGMAHSLICTGPKAET